MRTSSVRCCVQPQVRARGLLLVGAVCCSLFVKLLIRSFFRRRATFLTRSRVCVRHNTIYYGSVIFCEATAIYGVIMAIILVNKIKAPESTGNYLASGWDYNGFYYAGYGMFSAGLSVGLTNIASGVCGHHPK
jgi:F0F1-type ATP synthase membrane subunit c/vacuolar-type H+-ATPase subunit K